MADTAATDAGQYDSRAKTEDGASKADLVKMWLQAIALASETEKDWRKRAAEVEAIYNDSDKSRRPKFNILWSNTQTTVPALYNSRPEPDVRRRFNDDDPVGKLVAQINERAIGVTIDRVDFDGYMLAAVTDSEVAGRGATRVRYVPVMAPAEGDGEEAVADQRVEFEHVSWASIRFGPAKRWEGLPWIAFEHYLTREQLEQLNPDIGAKVKLESVMDGAKDQAKKDADGRNPPELFKRALTWEIWDAEKREVLFIAKSWPAEPLTVQSDPLELEGFFPIPRPLYGMEKSDSLVPTVPYTLYESQAKELEELTTRLQNLVKVLKFRGVKAKEISAAVDTISTLADGEFATVGEDGIVFGDKGIDKAIWVMPIEQAVNVMKELYVAREQVKQTIYELTGVSDILRGSTDPGETLGAQQIKAQWASLRLNRKQADVARYARDLFRLVAEIVASKFEWRTISMMTGIKLMDAATQQQVKAMAAADPQRAQAAAAQRPELAEQVTQPSREAVEAVLRRDLLREFRVDIESDSTVRADTERSQKNIANFVAGTGQFAQGVAPFVESGAMPAEVAIALFTSFARVFKLGKQAEDALDRWGEDVKRKAGQPQPDPAQAETDAKVAVEKEKLALAAKQHEDSIALEGKKHADLMAFEDRKHHDNMALEAGKAEADAMLRREEMALKREEIAAKMAGDAALERERMGAEERRFGFEHALKRDMAAASEETKRHVAERSAEAKEKAGAAKNGAA